VRVRGVCVCVWVCVYMCVVCVWCVWVGVCGCVYMCVVCVCVCEVVLRENINSSNSYPAVPQIAP